MLFFNFVTMPPSDERKTAVVVVKIVIKSPMFQKMNQTNGFHGSSHFVNALCLRTVLRFYL